VHRELLGGTVAPPAASSQEDVLSAARTRLRSGDPAARAELERLATSTDGRVARRASFTLAEMDLVNGDRRRAQLRLEDLLVGPEPALGADAATLVARSLPPGERAAVWKRYLSTSPPRPYVDRAQLDRADALLDAGLAPQARAILEEVKQSPSLTDAQRRQLERLIFKARELH
jgi:hypothetical protein